MGINVKTSDEEANAHELKLNDALNVSKRDSGVDSVNVTFESIATNDVMELKSPEKYRLEKRLQLVSNKLADANLQFATIEELEAQMKLVVNEREMLQSKLKDKEHLQIENIELLEKVRLLEEEKYNSNNSENEKEIFPIQEFEGTNKSNEYELEIKTLKEKKKKKKKKKSTCVDTTA